MCTICGCDDHDHPAHDHDHDQGGRGHGHDHDNGHGHGGVGGHVAAEPHVHSHAHSSPPTPVPTPASGEAGHVRRDGASGDLHYGAGAAGVSVPGMSQSRAIRIEQDVLGANNRVAARNRARFAQERRLALNLVSSPGSGKTTLLCATIEALRRRDPALPVAVVEGDQQTTHDADRIRATGAPAIQINTGKGCHLDAEMVGRACDGLDVHDGVLFIENVGNLVCPAMWDLGEAAKVAILSVTEGEDKPLKYPDMFAAARLVLLNKVDLLPHLRFDLARCIAYARQVNPRIQVLQVSALDGTGMEAWIGWVLHALDHARGHAHAHGEDDETARLRRRLAEAEAEIARLRAQHA